MEITEIVKAYNKQTGRQEAYQTWRKSRLQYFYLY